MLFLTSRACRIDRRLERSKSRSLRFLFSHMCLIFPPSVSCILPHGDCTASTMSIHPRVHVLPRDQSLPYCLEVPRFHRCLIDRRVLTVRSDCHFGTSSTSLLNHRHLLHLRISRWSSTNLSPIAYKSSQMPAQPLPS